MVSFDNYQYCILPIILELYTHARAVQLACSHSPGMSPSLCQSRSMCRTSLRLSSRMIKYMPRLGHRSINVRSVITTALTLIFMIGWFILSRPLAFSQASSATCVDGSGGQLFASTADVLIEIKPDDALYTSEIRLLSAVPRVIGTNYNTPQNIEQHLRW